MRAPIVPVLVVAALSVTCAPATTQIANSMTLQNGARAWGVVDQRTRDLTATPFLTAGACRAEIAGTIASRNAELAQLHQRAAEIAHERAVDAKLGMSRAEIDEQVGRVPTAGSIPPVRLTCVSFVLYKKCLVDNDPAMGRVQRCFQQWRRAK